jgi:Spy/CpxP family protein refolding chaperone
MKRMILTIVRGLLVTGLLVWGQDGIAQIIPEDSGKMMAMMDEDQGPLGRGMRMRHGGPGGPIGQIPSELAEKMALTNAQKDQMKSLNTAFAKDMARLEADAKIAQIELREVMDQTSPSIAAVKSQAAKVNEATGKIFERSVVFRAEMKSVLTAEQRKTMQEEGRQMRGERHGRERRRMRGPGSMQRSGGSSPGSDQ